MMLKKDIRVDPPEEDDELGVEDDSPAELEERDEELSTKASVKKALLELFKDVDTGFTSQAPRSDELMDYWDVYNCILNRRQFYDGTSQIFVPIVTKAVNARKTRFTNQIFPVSGRYVECTTQDGKLPHATIALAENYVRQAKLRTEVMPALMKNGDVEGHYSVYCSWQEKKRSIVRRVEKPATLGDGIDDDKEKVEDIEEQEVTTGHPIVEVLADSDVLVMPFTANSLSEAILMGGSVTIVRRWSKARIKQMIKDGDFTKEAGKGLLEAMTKYGEGTNIKNKAKKMAEAAGVHADENGLKLAVGYETWTMLTIKGKRVLCRAYYGGSKRILGCKRNPYWCDRLPIFSVPVEKVQGSFKGKSKVADVADLQYFANDTMNEAADSAAYALMPIIMTDPNKNPRVGSMILSMAAVWETSPNDTQFAKFPELWKSGLEIVGAAKNEIFETLGVNPAAITQQSATGKKRNQAEIAQEQQVDILTTADAVTVVEEGILTPLVNFFIELDHQYRTEGIMIKMDGQMGTRAAMEIVPPMQFDQKYQFRWFGVEAARNAQQVQQQIAGLNVLRGIPPQQLNGWKVDLVPIITQLVENTFGPRLAPLIFISPEQQMPVPADQENALLIQGFDVPTHALDDDQQHIQAHMAALQMAEGSKKKFQLHIMEHIQQMQRKQQAQMAQQQGAAPGGQQGMPGGDGPGVAGTPRMGAQPMMPKGGQQPPGAVHQDQMQDAGVMPRNPG
jgi:hypothetical protein